MQILRGDLHGLFGDLARGQLGVADQGGGRGEREGAAGADGGDAFVGLDHIAIAADDVGVFVVGDEQQGFQVAEHRGRCAIPWPVPPRSAEGCR